MFILRIRQTQNYLCGKRTEILSLHRLVRRITTLLDRLRNIPFMYVVEDSIFMKWRRLWVVCLELLCLEKTKQQEKRSHYTNLRFN
jgi:hypothetical protein